MFMRVLREVFFYLSISHIAYYHTSKQTMKANAIVRENISGNLSQIYVTAYYILKTCMQNSYIARWRNEWSPSLPPPPPPLLAVLKLQSSPQCTTISPPLNTQPASVALLLLAGKIVSQPCVSRFFFFSYPPLSCCPRHQHTHTEREREGCVGAG